MLNHGAIKLNLFETRQVVERSPERETSARRTRLDVDPIFGHLSIALPRVVHSRETHPEFKPGAALAGNGLYLSRTRSHRRSQRRGLASMIF